MAPRAKAQRYPELITAMHAKEDDQGTSVADAAASGDHLALLKSMRERIAAAISGPECPPRDLASLTRRLQDIAKDIKALEAEAEQEAAERDATDAHFDPETL